MITSKQIHTRDLPRLQDVTLRAVFRTGLRPFSKLLVAFDALLMKRVRSRRHGGIFDIALVMAIQASLRLGTVLRRCLMTLATGDQRAVIVAGVMVAIEAGSPISGCGGVGVMLKKDFTGIGLIHDANRFIGSFDRKGSIADYADK